MESQLRLESLLIWHLDVSSSSILQDPWRGLRKQVHRMHDSIRASRENRFQPRECGQSVIEFAFILPLLLILVFGITELGRMIMRTNTLTQAAREGARAAAVGADSTNAAARANVVLTAAGLDDNNPVVEVVGPDADQMMTVTCFCDFQVLPGTLLPFSGTLVLRGASAMRLEQ